MKAIAKLVVGVVVLLVLGTAMLPMLGNMVSGAVDTATTVALAILPKVAVLAGCIGLLLLCTHKTRAHGQKWIVGAVLCLIGALTISTVFAWIGTEAQPVAHASTNLAGEVLGRILTGLQAGIG